MDLPPLPDFDMDAELSGAKRRSRRRRKKPAPKEGTAAPGLTPPPGGKSNGVKPTKRAAKTVAEEPTQGHQQDDGGRYNPFPNRLPSPEEARRRLRKLGRK
jgi:hypothetical protein